MQLIEWADAAPFAPDQRAAYDDLAALADWSPWLPFEEARRAVPREPGVYLLREPDSGPVRYVGMAGERSGGGYPQGLRGRLDVYWTGKGAVSGFGEAALDRALADPDWVQSRLDRLRLQGPQRAKEWARDAVSRLGLQVSWTVCADRGDARYLEKQALEVCRQVADESGLWNR